MINPYLMYHQQQTGVLWVSGELEAQGYPVAPNNAVALWDSSTPVIYLKQADASGRPSMKIYDLTERTKTAQNAAEVAGGVNLQDYALKSEFDGILSEISALKTELKKVQKELKRRELDDDE